MQASSHETGEFRQFKITNKNFKIMWTLCKHVATIQIFQPKRSTTKYDL